MIYLIFLVNMLYEVFTYPIGRRGITLEKMEDGTFHRELVVYNIFISISPLSKSHLLETAISLLLSSVMTLNSYKERRNLISSSGVVSI